MWDEVPNLGIEMRAASPADYEYARSVHHAGMRWIAERLFGWDDAEQAAKFERQFVLSEVRIIMVDGEKVGYLQVTELPDALLLKELHISAPSQNRGIGSVVLRQLFAEAHQLGKPITVSVVKFNPALALYQRLGFKVVGEDVHKFYLHRESAQT